MKDSDQRSHPSEADQGPGTAAEPRWPALVAALAVAGIYGALPASLSAGPRWLALVITAVLLVPSVLTHRSGRHHWNRIVGYCITGVLTAFMIWSLVLLVRALPAHKESPIALLRSGATLWISNVLVFALWYWRLDAGGPYSRGLRPGHTEVAFLFPQMTMPAHLRKERWSPMFIDYLFLAFNTSTALSPTDVPILSRWAKIMVMIQALISLTVTVILVARAVNIL